MSTIISLTFDLFFDASYMFSFSHIYKLHVKKTRQFVIDYTGHAKKITPPQRILLISQLCILQKFYMSNYIYATLIILVVILTKLTKLCCCK